MFAVLRKLTLAVVVGTSLAIFPGSAAAQDDADTESGAEADSGARRPVSEARLKKAQKYFRAAEKRFTLRQFEEALYYYQRAYEQAPLPKFLLNFGQCYRSLGQYDDAIFAFQRYLELEPNSADAPDVEQTIKELRRARDRASERKRRPIPALDFKREARSSPLVVDEKPAFYTRWWFYAGTAVVLGAATAAYVYLPSDSDADIVFDARL
jgi:tetratricopeptide (TPR) repeat protein